MSTAPHTRPAAPRLRPGGPGEAEWGQATFALVLPYPLALRTHALVQVHGPRTKAEAAMRAWLSPEFRDAPLSVKRQVYSPAEYFYSPKIERAALAPLYARWERRPDEDGRPPRRTELVEPFPYFRRDQSSDLPPVPTGLRLRAVERMEFPGDPLGYVTLHLEAAAPLTPEHLEALLLHLRRPGNPGQRWNRTDILLRQVGVAGAYAPGGFVAPLDEAGEVEPPPTAEPSRSRLVRLPAGAPTPDPDAVPPLRNSTKAFLLSFLVPRCAPTAPSTLRDYGDWDPVDAWLFMATSGIDVRYGTLRRPHPVFANNVVEPFCVDSLRAHASPGGLATVGDPSLLELPYKAERLALEARVHLHWRSVCLMALRQRTWLETAGERMAAQNPSLASTDLAGYLAYLQRLDGELSEFRNQVWFEGIPGRLDASAVLEHMQAAMRTRQLLAEIVEEEDWLMRRVKIRSQAAEAQARDEEERLQRAEVRRKEAAQEAREEHQASLEMYVALLAVASLVLGAGALFDQPSLTGGVGWTAAALAAMLTTAVVVRGYQRLRSEERQARRRRKPSRSGGDPATGHDAKSGGPQPPVG